MKILLFGGSGQLGAELRPRAKDLNFEMIAPVTAEVNISEQQQVVRLIKEVKPDVVVNAAAYTAVDQAESEPDIAYKVNRDGVQFIGEGAKAIGCRVMHISTDYVFDGSLARPLTEEDPTSPPNVYGASKRAGEEALLTIYPEGALVIRTSSLHGSKGMNFVHTMLKLFNEKPELSVVDDQLMSPTYAGWLAEVVLDLARTQATGIVHASGSGAISWFTFAQEIRRLAIKQPNNQVQAVLKPIPAADFYRPARRPSYSVMDCSRLQGLLGRPSISWQQGLKSHLRDLGFES